MNMNMNNSNSNNYDFTHDYTRNAYMLIYEKRIKE